MSTAERICEEPPGEAPREVLEFVEILKARHGERGEEGRTLSGAELATAVDELRALTGSQPLTRGDAVRGMRDEARYYSRLADFRSGMSRLQPRLAGLP
jgi:hypothetical protein